MYDILFDTIFFVNGVSTNPGARALILILYLAYVEAADITKPDTADLALEIASWFFKPIFDAALEKNIKLPPSLRKYLKLCFKILKQLKTLTLNISSTI